MRSAAGRLGAASTNMASSRRRVERELTKAQAAQAAATGAIAQKDVALVALDPALAPLSISTPAAVEQTILRAITAVFDGSLPPARARAVDSLLQTRIRLADLELSKIVFDMKAELDRREGKGSRPGRRNVPTPRFRS
jgi:hypothetical protein